MTGREEDENGLKRQRAHGRDERGGGDGRDCRVHRQLARWKVPRRVIFVTGWPMSATKVQKFRLAEQFPSPEATP